MCRGEWTSGFIAGVRWNPKDDVPHAVISYLNGGALAFQLTESYLSEVTAMRLGRLPGYPLPRRRMGDR